MAEANLKELLPLLTEDQKKVLNERMIQRRAGKAEDNKIQQRCDIAIIGLGGKYPQSDNHYDFWSKLQQGVQLIEEVPEDRWEHSKYFDPSMDKVFIPYKTRCKYGAFLEAYDEFDASFFEINSDEVFLMDPQERIALETTWACIEDAGYVPSSINRNTGVFSGITYNEYQKLVPFTSHSYMLNNRIAFFFNLKGPAVTTDGGSCSSLTAIHLACQSLNKNECETAIVIGSNMILHPDHYTSLSPMLSKTDKPHSNPFGKDDGWIPAEGVVSILLKPLKKALKDKDHVYGVIKSSHICQEGKTSWFMAFNPKQQARLIQENFELSGIHPETISYIEAAANGSSLGDAIEIEGLTAAFNPFSHKDGFCSIGSVKSNVGHGEAVSTLLQLTKLLLQFKSQTLIPIMNLEEVNPNINIENSPFYFQTTSQKWERPLLKLNNMEFNIPRRATISSFGSGGNIGHLILEEYIQEDREKQKPDFYFIPLSSKTYGQLRQTVESYIKFFKEYQRFDSYWEAHYTLLNIMFTLCIGRVSLEERIVFIAGSLDDLVEKFHKFLNGESESDIILKTGADSVSLGKEIEQAQIQQWLKDKSWHKLGGLWVQGANIPWNSFFAPYKALRVPLPTYCFQRQHFPIPRAAYPGDVNGSSITETAFKVKSEADSKMNCSQR